MIPTKTLTDEFEFTKYESREEWLEARKSFIGGSDAACILGLNPWKNNQQLWDEKMGNIEPSDVGDNPLVLYGTRAEEYLRELFALDFPQYAVFHDDFAIYVNPKYPWAHASLDGWLVEKQAQGLVRGILEIKTATIGSAAQKAKWENGIPQNYYCQVLHYFMVTGFDFAVLKAQLKYENNGEVFLQTKHYRINRSEVREDIEYLIEKERDFAEHIKNGTAPALILPEI